MGKQEGVYGWMCLEIVHEWEIGARVWRWEGGEFWNSLEIMVAILIVLAVKDC